MTFEDKKSIDTHSPITRLFKRHSNFRVPFFLFLVFLTSLTSLFFIFTPTPTLAVTSTWIGATGGGWQNAANWDNGIPTSTMNVLISSSTDLLINATGTINFNLMQIGGGTASSTLVLTGNFGTSTNVTIASNGVLRQDNIVAQTLSGTLLIQDGGTLTHTTNTTALAYEINISANTTTINSGGRVNVDSLGYAGGALGFNGNGPGQGLYGADGAGSGAAHGGNGGNAFISQTTLGGTAYCSLSNVSTLGSGGGGGTSASPPGGNGGGLIILNATTTMTINGSISANGGNGGASYAGGGAGGGVKLTANTIAGSPSSFSIIGGNGGTVTDPGGGGGGCAQLTYTASNSITSSTVSMSGGTGLMQGGAGQLMLKATTGNGDLYVVGNASGAATSTANESYTLNSLSLSYSTYQVSSTQSLTLTNSGNPFNTSTNTSTLAVAGTITLNYNTIDHGVNLRILNGGTFTNSTTLNIGNTGGAGGLRIDNGGIVSNTITTLTSSGTLYFVRTGTFTINNLIINTGTTTLDSYTTSSAPLTFSGNFVMNGGLLNHVANTTTQTHIINISANNVTVASGAAVNVDSLGYAGGALGFNGNGPGQGLYGADGAGSGAAHGGNGGNAFISQTTLGGTAYCSLSNVSTLGSGGGGGTSASPPGGNGGGLIILNATTTMTINGSISANGGNGGASYAGGGAGGGVKLTANTIAGSPSSFSIIGGNGGTVTYPGGGGGGCAFVHYTNTSSINPSIITRSGGTGLNAGVTGTISVVHTPGAATTGAVTTSTIALNWSNSNPGTETYYVLQRSTDGVTFTFVATTTPTTTVTYTFTGLTANTRYWLEVGAGDSSNVTSSYSTSSPIFTLGNAALAPTIGTPTTSTLPLTINTNNNPTSSIYAIYNTTTAKYLDSTGAATSTPVFLTTSTWGSSLAAIGLSLNTSYQFVVISQNGDGTNAATSTASTAKFTLANPATAPTIGTPTTSTLPITINVNNNPTNTTFAIFNTTTQQYLTSGGVATSTPTYFSTSTWNNGSAVGLSLNATYQFITIARNGDGTNSASSSASTGKYTLTNSALAPTIGTPTTSTLPITINVNGNPTNTLYAIFNTTTQQYLTSAGVGTTTPTYFTTSTWNAGSAVGLSLNTPYQFVVISQNGDGTNAATSSASTATYTLTNPATAPTIGTPTTSTLPIIINVNNNPTNTTYAIFNTSTAQFLDSNGNATTTAVYFTTSTWNNGSAVGLSLNTSYQFVVISQNGGGVNAATSSASIAKYTLGNAASAPTIGTPTTSTLPITINVNGNSTNTTYAIFNTTTQQYLTSVGAATSTPTYFTTSTWNNGSATGLSLNTTYQFIVIARNGDGTNSASSSASIAKYTLTNSALAPTIGTPTTSTLPITINVNGNSTNTTYAIFNTSTQQYLTNAGVVTSTPTYFTTSTWNAGSATGLSLNTTYQFIVIARNGDGTNAASSSASVGKFTLANPASTPTIGSPTTSTLPITINVNSNPTNTQYAIYNTSTQQFIDANGNATSTAVYFTTSSWNNGSAVGLSLNTLYQFVVISQNGDGTNASTSSVSNAVYTLANGVLSPTIGTPTTSTLPININTNNNPTTTLYAIFNTTTQQYLTSSGVGTLTPTFFTTSTWGSGSAVGLSINTSYQFVVIAQNGGGVNAATSSASVGKYTLVNPPTAPTLTTPAVSSLNLAIGAGDLNPTTTLYSVYSSTTAKYLYTDGTPTTTEFFAATSTWGTLVVTGLTANTPYTFQTRAKNSGNVTTTLSTASTLSTLPTPVSGGSGGGSSSLGSGGAPIVPVGTPLPIPTLAIIINNGAQTTLSPLASVQVIGSGGGSTFTSIMLSNFQSFAQSTWQPYSGSPIPWTLAPYNGLKVVSARLKDNGGSLSSLVSSSILYQGGPDAPTSTASTTTTPATSTSTTPVSTTTPGVVLATTTIVTTTPTNKPITIPTTTVSTSTPITPSPTTTPEEPDTLLLAPGKTYKFLQFMVNVTDKQAPYTAQINLTNSDNEPIGKPQKVTKQVKAHATQSVIIPFPIPKNIDTGNYTFNINIRNQKQKIVATGKKVVHIEGVNTNEQVLGVKIGKKAKMNNGKKAKTSKKIKAGKVKMSKKVKTKIIQKRKVVKKNSGVVDRVKKTTP